MRLLTKPSTAQCDLNLYILFLLAEPKYISCIRLARLLEDLSHDSVNRFLLRERYGARDLFNMVSPHIDLLGGTLSGDDSVIDKPYSDPHKAKLIDYFWSGKHKRAVKGINIISLYYTDINGVSVPVNYRINDKGDGKTKNDYFQEMVAEVIQWGLSPFWITADSWYASVETLKLLRHQELGFLFGIESNRLVSIESGQYTNVRNLEIPEDGLMVHLKQFGKVKVFRTVFKNEYRYYIMYLPELKALQEISRAKFKSVHDLHWGIERYHRALKQVCNIERFQVRASHAIRTHIFGSLCAFVELELKRSQQVISNWYELRRHLFDDVIRSFILENLGGASNDPDYCPDVNA